MLVVDDDPIIRKLTWRAFQSTGLLIYQADSIDSAIDISSRISFDLFLLDVGLTYENDGYYLAQHLREHFPLAPIIFLSGKTEEQDIITGLETGADYYITKPFSIDYLKAQVTSTLNRYQTIKKDLKPVAEKVNVGPFQFDKKTFSFYKNEDKIEMSSKEANLMLFFMENPNQVFSKEQILLNVWNDQSGEANLVKVYINYLRNKIEDDPKKPEFLKTIWGIGYSFTIN
ncbi:response regulator transcription factor [Vagococcus carniphilus]|uniref:response regulator transcription factor n=1 Tax=Vagococcus carniphilus TaxID=218144 RepID=UPI003BA879C9